LVFRVSVQPRLPIRVAPSPNTKHQTPNTKH
jgi:hypothetical protein